MARVISIFNAKGGVGKTTTAVNVGAYLALAGRRVLLVDFDPQGNASSALGQDPARQNQSIYHGIFSQADVEELVKPSVIYNYHVLPSAPHLAGALVELVEVEGREYLLRRFLQRVRHEYDYIIIDLAPSITLLTVNALIASDEVIIPIQAEYYGLEGVHPLLETIDLLRNNLAHNLDISGALLTMVDHRERFNREVAQNVRENFPHGVFTTEIPRSIALAEAPSYSLPVLLHRPDSAGALAYRRLAEEIVAQEHTLNAHEGRHKSPDFGNLNI